MDESIIERIIRLVSEQGVSDKEFCDNADVPQSTYGNWKTRGSNPSTKYIPGIARALKKSEKYILTGEELDLIDEIIVEVNKRPELELLFKTAKGASKKEIEEIIRMVNTFKGNS